MVNEMMQKLNMKRAVSSTTTIGCVLNYLYLYM